MTTTTNEPTVAIPQPTKGPTARLQINDTATQIMLTSWLAELAKGVQDTLAGHLSPAGIVGAAVTTLITVVVLAKKHDLAGALVNALPPVVALTQQVAAAVAPGALDALRADLADLKAQVDAIPADQRQAALDALTGLITDARPAAALAPAPAETVPSV